MARHVLAYHDVRFGVAFETSAGTISARLFRRQCEALAERGWRGVSLRDADLGADDGTFVLTVDDGYESVLRHVIPACEEYGWTGTVFVPTAAIGRRGEWDVGSIGSARHLDGDALRHVETAGWEVGSHGVTHRALTDISEEEAEHELRDSRDGLTELLGGEVASLSYPFGAVNAALARLAREAGYRRGVTMRPGRISPSGDTLGLPRWPVYFMDGPESLVVRFEGPGWLRVLERMKASAVHSFAYGSRVVMRGARNTIET